MLPTPSSQYDVAIAGAGPIGCAAALAFARQGKRVFLAEAQPQVASRMAGEWLHPAGVAALSDLLDATTVNNAPAVHAHGFVVQCEGRQQVLPYAPGHYAWSFHHRRLVDWLRQKAAESSNINLLLGGQLKAMPNGRAQLSYGGENVPIKARLLLAADGKASRHARQLGASPGQTLGAMAGVLLKNCQLPCEGFAHVFLGGLGPILAYRLDATTVRLILDFPMPASQARQRWDAYLPTLTAILPPTLYDALRSTMLVERPTWAAVGFRSRQLFGQGRLRLLGDAAGYLHPLTAAGLTLGLQDVQALCRSNGNLKKYANARRQQSAAPELLSNALYRVFCGQAAGAATLRDAVLDAWSRSPRLRRQTMALLGCDELNRYRFAAAFAEIGLAAVADEWLNAWPDWRQGWRRTATLATWAEWPLKALLPQTLTQRQRRLPQQPKEPWPDAKSNTTHARTKPQSQLTALSSASKEKPMAAIHDDLIFCRNALAAVSRTFAQPIAMLEGDLQTTVMCGYLLCRIADTIEDDPDLAPGLRDHLFELFLRTLDQENDPAAFALAFPKVRDDDPEIILARQAPRVFNVLATTPPAMQKIVCRWVGEMTRGMAIYKNRGGDRPDGVVTLLTPGDLERYCYFVAGTVGHMLTELFLHQTPTVQPEQQHRLYENAEAFGMGLQLVNIIKDIAEDRERGVSYMPLTLLQRRNLTAKTLFDARDHAALAPLFKRARDYLRQALDYTLALPASAIPVRRFCLFPLLLAADTLALAENNDALFSNRPDDKVKVSRAAVAAALNICQNQVADDDAITQAVLDRLASGAPLAAAAERLAV